MRDGEREQKEGMGREGKRGERLLFSFERQVIVFRKPCSSVGVIGARKRAERHRDRRRQATKAYQKGGGNNFPCFYFCFIFP